MPLNPDTLIITQDVITASGAPASRVSQAMSGLGVRGWRAKKGREPLKLTTEEAIRVLLTRRLQDLGMLLGDAVAAVNALASEDFRDIIATDQAAWLVVGADGAAELCGAARMLELAENRGGGLQGLRVVNVHTAIKDLFAARLQRLGAEGGPGDASRVSTYKANRGQSGVYLHRSMRLAVFKNGSGHAIQLDPATARDLASQLQRLADEAEAPPAPEAIN